MKFIKHAMEQPFITATGIAALVHSTWALGTIFSGPQPAVEDISSLIELIHFVGWLVPALLIAFALDVGQISTSSKIRHAGITWGRGTTFVVFSLATFFLQWLYMMHHIPMLEVGAGVSAAYRPVVEAMRDAALFIVPSLLPIATILYTLSGDDEDAPAGIQEPAIVAHAGIVSIPESPLLDAASDASLLIEAEYPVHDAVCDCGWTRTYDNADSARKGLSAHQQKCSVFAEVAEPVMNGHYSN